MINVINDSTDPYFNLALEEYFLKYRDLQDDILILWQNEPTIVVGKNQNTFQELNSDYVDRHGIHIARRMSGGGAVYHDLGNLNYTIIKVDGESYRNDFSFFAIPVINCLKKYNVEAEFNGRNDITIDKKKFSGNAQYFYKQKVLHHGTLMFASDLNVLSKALKVNMEKIQSKGIKSVKARVANISDYMSKSVPLNEFRKSLILSMYDNEEKNIRNYQLSKEDIVKINELRDNKYITWEWNFGNSPEMNYKKEMRFKAGNISASMNINDGIIRSIKINGDFFEEKSVKALEHILEGVRYDKYILEKVIDKIDVSEYIYLLKNEELIKLLFNI